MTRPPRFNMPGIPQHVIQRGHNRLPCFLDDTDRQQYLQCLAGSLRRFSCQLHAYVLMSNHVHLLVTPREVGALSRMMHTFSRNYVAFFNDRHARTGTLWEGRYKACVVDSGTYFLTCSRYIELNPVRAWMVARPNDYPWSSYRANAEGQGDPLLTRHPEYLVLGTDTQSRASAYRRLFDEVLSDRQLDAIRGHVNQQKAFGTDRFQVWVEARTGHFAGLRQPGRPKNSPFSE